MKWVYILHCEDDNYYVGETKRLYRRFWEHDSGLGGINTSCYTPENIVALYSVDRLHKFFNYTYKVNANKYDLTREIYFNENGLLENFNETDDDFGDDKSDS
jgi:predicted GIY-YIG superfamily endonuclease